MRDLMAIVESAGRPPRFLFHGTSDSAWAEIQQSDAMQDDPARPSGGVCFSASRRVAEEFARFSCQRHDDERGVVIEIDGEALARDFAMVRHHADLSNPLWKIADEEEWRVTVPRIDNISRYVLGTYEVWRDSYDDPAEWGPGAKEWREE